MFTGCLPNVCKLTVYHVITNSGKRETTTSLSSEGPIFLQQGPQSRQGLSPNLLSPTTDQTAGALAQALHMSQMGGVICKVKGYPVGGSIGCMSLKRDEAIYKMKENKPHLIWSRTRKCSQLPWWTSQYGSFIRRESEDSLVLCNEVGALVIALVFFLFDRSSCVISLLEKHE